MIITKLQGGLGNQMFQYAAGRALSARHHTSLYLDHRFLEKKSEGEYTQRKFELEAFDLKSQKAEQANWSVFNPDPNRFQRVIQRALPSFFKNLVAVESGFGYHANFEHFPQNTLLSGFWQSEKYFLPIKQLIRDDFKIRHEMPRLLTDLFSQIKNSNSVSIHVRRGDFVNLASAQSFHGLLELSYYKKALIKMQAEIADFKAFIFSDDPDWCAQNFGFIENKIIIRHSELAVWDLFLMQNCKHHIIANSSFSWWGAWLNPNTNKVVVMPQQWYRQHSAEEVGIKPEGWICL